MADLEQRRQQYNSDLNRRQWEADPQGKLIETLGPLLEWIGQQHRAKDALTPEEQAVATDALIQGGLLASYLVPELGIPANMAYEADQLEKEHAAGNADASVAPLLVAALPMGALESRAGNLAGRAARAVQGAEKALAPAAVMGGPLLVAGTAQAGEADQGAAGTDPVRAQYEQQLQQINDQIAATTERLNAEKASGYGPKAKAADEQINALMAQAQDLTEKLRSYKSPQDIAGLEGHRWSTVGTGFGLGAAAALPFVVGAALKRRKGVADFKRVAGQLDNLMASTPEALPGSLAGDKAFALMNEAYRAADAPAPFVRRGGGSFTPVADIGGSRARASADSALFDHGPKMPGSTAIPLALAAEGAATTAYGMGGLEPIGMKPATPEEAQMYQTMGLGSLGLATGMKTARKLGEAVLPKADALLRATVNQARNRLEREMAAGAEPSLWSRMFGGKPSGSGGGGGPLPMPGTEPPAIPGGPPRLAAEPSPTPGGQPAANQTASEVSSVPGSLAPDTGAKKVKPKKDAQGRWRGEHGHFVRAETKTRGTK